MLNLLTSKTALVAVIALLIFAFSATVAAHTNYYATGAQAPTTFGTISTVDKRDTAE